MTIFRTLWPKQNHPVIWLRHNGENKHLATALAMYFLDMLIMDLFPIYFTQNRYICFYFLTLAFYFVPSLGNLPRLQQSSWGHATLVDRSFYLKVWGRCACLMLRCAKSRQVFNTMITEQRTDKETIQNTTRPKLKQNWMVILRIRLDITLGYNDCLPY